MGVVSALRLRVERGRFVLDVPDFATVAGGTAVLGPNGAGKTTLLHALAGLLPARGEVTRPARSASVFALPAVLRGTTRWNVAVVARATLRIANDEAHARADAVLAAVGLGDAAGADARRLSVGQRQRLALARALVLRPDALFLDEPFANVDADARPALRALVRAYAEETGCALVLATSSLADVTALCSAATVLREGRVTTHVPVPHLERSDDAYIRALLTESTASTPSWPPLPP